MEPVCAVFQYSECLWDKSVQLVIPVVIFKGQTNFHCGEEMNKHQIFCRV